jgi:hypothetical protein
MRDTSQRTRRLAQEATRTLLDARAAAEGCLGAWQKVVVGLPAFEARLLLAPLWVTGSPSVRGEEKKSPRPSRPL